MKKEKTYSLEDISKYSACFLFTYVLGMEGVANPLQHINSYYESILKDLQNGSMEKAIIEYDRINQKLKQL